MTIPAGYAQVNMIFSGSAVPTGAQTTFGLNVENEAVSPEIVAQGVASAYATSEWDNLTAAGCDLTSVLVKFGPDATGPAATIGTSVTGKSDAAGYAGASVLVSKLTGVGGRKGRGRMFLPGIPESQIGSGGVIVGAALTAWQGAIDSFFADLEEDWPHVLLHSDDTVPYLVTSTPVQGRAATQRRRQRR